MSRWKRPRWRTDLVENEDGDIETVTYQRRPNTSRGARRTDFHRWRKGAWFSRGRSFPVTRLALGVPDVFNFSVGMAVGTATGALLGYLTAIDYSTGDLFYPTPGTHP